MQGKKQSKKQKELPHPSSYTAEQLEEYFKGLFSIADANADGVLQPDELEKLLQLCGFALSAEEIAQFVSEADTNGDGVIEHSEFVPVATKMLQATAHVEDEGCSGVDAAYISVALLISVRAIVGWCCSAAAAPLVLFSTLSCSETEGRS